MNEEVLKKLEKKLKKVKIEGFIINQGNERIFEYFKSKKIKEKPTKVLLDYKKYYFDVNRGF
ncbi:hypothetical protein KDN24_23415 [Bacillus sp. Bva_UNVM-123]|uniref:hypothetical protein n=1 Tax=Bacillus sp. Bva_UNVM-123 TaxID=2829798 RepID=UPI00391F4895